MIFMRLRALFAIFVFTSLFILISVPAQAQEIDLSVSAVPTATPTPKPQQVDYTLPYPGMLPDNPLYVLKAARDRMIEFLISDPAKKAEFYLLSSDKRVNTGYYLILKNKDDMGVLYVSKGTNYMDKAITSAKSSGERGKGVLQNIKTSIKKHEEVIQGLMSKVGKENRTKLNNEIARLVKMESRLLKK